MSLWGTWEWFLNMKERKVAYPTMQRERLERLRDHMLKLQAGIDAGLPPDRAFHMGTWWSRDAKDHGLKLENVYATCESACCLLGEAATIPEFNAQGLSVQLTNTWGESLRFPQILLEGHEDDEEDDKGKDFFGLNFEETSFLFFPDGYAEELETEGKIVSTDQDDWLSTGEYVSATDEDDEDWQRFITPGHAARHIERVLAGEFRIDRSAQVPVVQGSTETL